MTSPVWVRLSALALISTAFVACDSLEVADSKFGIIFVPTERLADGTFVTTPSAFFFQASGVRLASTQVGAEGCIVQAIQPAGSDSFQRIDAGDAVAVNVSGNDAVLNPYAAGAQVTYQLPEGEKIPFTPGDQITVSIPGAPGGFPARVVMVETVPAFTPAEVTLPAATTSDLTVTWTPASTSTTTAMFYSFRYASENSSLIDQEIACVFADDGSGVVPASTLTGFRQSEPRMIIAQRARIVAERIGEAITHVTTTMSVPVELNEGI